MTKQRLILLSSLLTLCCSFTASAANTDTEANTDAAAVAETTDAPAQTTESTDTEQTITEPETIDQAENVQSAQAESIRYTCSLQNLTRRIEIDYMSAEAVVPCEVGYYKDVETPGIKQILWSAQNQEGYCEGKAQDFVNKLVGLGWNCEAQ